MDEFLILFPNSSTQNRLLKCRCEAYKLGFFFFNTSNAFEIYNYKAISASQNVNKPRSLHCPPPYTSFYVPGAAEAAARANPGWPGKPRPRAASPCARSSRAQRCPGSDSPLLLRVAAISGCGQLSPPSAAPSPHFPSPSPGSGGLNPAAPPNLRVTRE